MLFAIGGALDQCGDKQVLKRLLKEARGLDSQICVVTSATGYPEEIRQEYDQVLRSLGVRRHEILHIADKSEAGPLAAEFAKRADIIFFSGGDQRRLVERLKGTVFMEVVSQRFQEGCIVAGTSAGAAAMSQKMIYCEDAPNGAPGQVVSLEEGFGLGLAGGMVIDTHFSQRNRLDRLFAQVARSGGKMGVGLDEDTAAIIRPDATMEIFGAGGVTVIDEGSVSVLRSGETYNIRQRTLEPF